MIDHQYFNGWQINGYKSSLYSEFSEDQEVITEQSINETDLILQEFIINPKQYFDTYQEESCTTISERLDDKLIETDPGLFVESYKKVLNLVCFCEDKELPLKTIVDTVTIDRKGRDEIIAFLLTKGLIKRTYRVLATLNIDEQEIFLDILEQRSI
jgi:hypothetical protein